MSLRACYKQQITNLIYLPKYYIWISTPHLDNDINVTESLLQTTDEKLNIFAKIH